MAKVKMTKDIVPEGFTMGLALVDALPVLFFGGSMVVAAVLSGSSLFLIGALLCLFAGAAKVLWKIIVVLKKRNVWWLFMQMRLLMPIGFVLMLLGLVLKGRTTDLAAVFAPALAFPALAFIIAGVVGMVLMVVFAIKLDSSDVKANWIEQLTNGISQACFFIALLITALVK